MIKLYQGDCLEYMKSMQDKSVDCIVTDPPYGIGWTRGTWEDDPTKYGDLMCQLVTEANRITGGGPVFVWQALLNVHLFHKWFPPGYRIFAACKGFVQYRPTGVQWSWDPVVFWGDFKRMEISVWRKDFYVTNTAQFGAGRENIDHPSPKPLSSVAYVIDLASLPGDTVFDPFMGSGTTGVAAVQLGRSFVGCEIDPKYFETAKKRIDAASAQGNLFHKNKIPEQMILIER